MITTLLDISIDRCNWSNIAQRNGMYSYQDILFYARDVLAYYREITNGPVYTRIRYVQTTHTDGTTAIQVECVNRNSTGYGEIATSGYLDAQAAIEEAERIIKNH